MRVALLDVNVLLALFDSNHVHHEPAHDWFEGHRSHGWATCSFTENGFMRVAANPAYGLGSMRVGAAAALLHKFRASGHHAFWPDTASLCDGALFNLAMASGHRQVTDIYLLGLAVKMKGRLATFDRGIPLKAVVGATPAALMVIGSE